MLARVEIKICGLTTEEDVDLALSEGADFFGFIVYPKSPRGLSLERAASLSKRIPPEKRVIVDVEPRLEDLARYRDAGFANFQIHASVPTSLATAEAWSGIVGKSRLWLAPRLQPGDPFPESLLAYADTILVDTYSSQQIGGTGQTGDWGSFSDWRQAYPSTKWVLAGGLHPANVLDAIAATGAEHIDVNSGVELRPGKKDPAKLQELFRVMRSSA
jgi:phosphoribosylanthranilate isomerase